MTVRPNQLAFVLLVIRSFMIRAAGEDAALSLDHDVARVIPRCADQIDVVQMLRPFANRFGASACFAKAASCEDEPIAPIAGRDELIGPRPEFPIVEKFVGFIVR